MKKIFIWLLLLLGCLIFAQQDTITIDSTGSKVNPNKDLPQLAEPILPGTEVKDMGTYQLNKLEVTGGTPYSTNQILRFTGLRLGETLEIPGSKINNAIKKLWRTNLFSDVEFFATQLQGNRIDIRVDLVGLPVISEVSVKGVRKARREDFIEENKLIKGAKITQNLLNQTKNNIKKYYTEKGFPDATVTFTQKSDTAKAFSKNLIVNIDRGPRVKIKSIDFHGNSELRDGQLRRKGFKKTRQRSLNIFKSSKLIPEEYQNDLSNLIDLYKSKGFRDVKIISDSIRRIDKKNYAIDVTIDEGKRYYLGDVEFVGNSAYSTDLLQRILSYSKGDPYDAVGLSKKVSGSDKDDDISTLYLDNGYLFSSVTPVETSVVNDTINLQIRIQEGQQATWNKVTFSGNTQTHDHVIARELRTRPGELFSKSDIKRTYRELGSLGYFDPQQISQNINPNPETNTVDIEWKLAHKSSSQIELQGGYGGGRFIGTLGLTFGNFSAANLFKKEAWKPVPLGDGQSVSLRVQAGSNFSNYSISFTEPWITGSRPTSLTVRLSNSNYSALYNEDSKLNIYNAAVSLNKMLTWPDDYFRLRHTLSFQRYQFNEYPLDVGSLNLREGNSNNVSYEISLSRLSSGPNPIFPTSGSNFSASLKLTPPYSLLGNKDYKGLKEEGNFEEVYKWTEYYKFKFDADWYKQLIGKLVLRTKGEFGFMGDYNSDIGVTPFERFYVGGTGLQQNRFDGREIVPLRGYEDFSRKGGTLTDVTPLGGGTVYNKYMLELRYPISLSEQATIFGLGFFEAANTWQGTKNYNPFELKRSAGVGLRVFMSAFGMLGFDFGYGFDPNIIGPDEASGWQTHFIFGQQF